MVYGGEKTEKTDSNTPTGTFSHLDLFARMGKNVPEAEVARITKTDAIRRPVYVSAPPPSPQFDSEVVEDMIVTDK